LVAGAIEAKNGKGIDLAVYLANSRFQRIEQIVRRNVVLAQPFDDIAGRCPHEFFTGSHEIASRLLAALMPI
jgi:hypothetical protein